MKASIVAIVLTQIMFAVSMIVATIYGLVLAFKASLVLGFLVLLVEPAPLVLGVVAFFGHPELAQALAKALGLGS